MTFVPSFETHTKKTENELYFNASSFEEMQNITTALWKAVRRDIENVTESIGGSIRLYDTPQSNITRLEIGLACLFLKRGSDSILAFRYTLWEEERTNFLPIPMESLIQMLLWTPQNC